MPGLSNLFPLYPENAISGPFHVSLSIPGPISDISKSIGITSSTALLLPNLDYLTKFANGSIGIADSIKKSGIVNNINKCKSEPSFKQFAKLLKLDIPNPSKYKTKTGYSIPPNLITIDPSDDLMGISSMEKTILKSIFETQKPYIDIINLVIGNISKVEDIIARVMPLISPVVNPLDKLNVKSEKPRTNSGNNGRPKAMGYKSGQDIKTSLGKLKSLSGQGKGVSIDKNGKAITSPKRTDPTAIVNQPDSGSDVPNTNYKIVSTVYSTGEFDPSLKYKYIYKDIKDTSFGVNDLKDQSNLNLSDDDPYGSLKPKNLIFGIFNSKGDAINPMTKLKSLDNNGNEVDTPYYVADWITKSPKWYFKNGQFTWPRFASPFYYWTRYNGADIVRSQSKPDPGSGDSYTKKKYDTGLRKGQDIVDFTGLSERTEFINYFTDLVTKKINSSTGIDSSQKKNYISTVLGQLNVKDSEGSKTVGPYTLNFTQIDNHLENVFNYGILSSSTFVNPNTQQPIDIPSGMKYSLKPSQIVVAGITGSNTIWVDPESDYDLKIIKVDSVLNIEYQNSLNGPTIETQIIGFIKNSLVINIDNNKVNIPFSISVSKNKAIPTIIENITEYNLDNWNFDGSLPGSTKPSINNNNLYDIEVWRYEENPFFVGKNKVDFTIQGNVHAEMERIIGDPTSQWSYKEYSLGSDGVTKTYIQVDNIEKTLFEKSLIEINNYKVKRWIVWRDQVGAKTSVNTKKIMPPVGKKNTISLLYGKFGNNEKFDVSSSLINIPQFQISVKDNTKYGKMIDPSEITNSQLTHTDLYSKGKYGGSPQEVGSIKRSMKTELDVETYYIIEGVLVESNVQNGPNGSNLNNTNPNNQSGGGTEWYKMPDALGATKVFLSMLTDIFSKLIPSIESLLKLFKNPASFITDIISEKLGESFLIFSPEAMSTMSRLPGIPIADRKDFVSKSVLSNYISVNTDGSYRFLLDGSSLMKLPILGNTVTFGMQLSMFKPMISLINSIDFTDIPNKTLDSFLNKTAPTKSPLGSLGNVDLRPDQNTVKNKIVTQSGGTENIEDVSIQYSTGKFIEGVDYTYIYLTDYVAKLVKEADDLSNTNDPDNLELAKSKLDLALKSDPKNALINAKLDDLVKKTNNYIQPILKFIIEIVSLPIKIISGIIQYIMDFFKSLTSLPTLPSKMSDFLSFKWILDFFKPATLLSLAGITFDVSKLLGWISNLDSYDANYEFDLSEVIDISLLAKLPKVKKAQFIDMLKKPLNILQSVLCFLESLINAIIDFVWSSLGIEAIIIAPHIKLCKQLNQDVSTQDMMDLLNGLLKDPGVSSSTNAAKPGDSHNFIYEIKLPDGTIVRNLDQVALKQFVEDNKGTIFDFLFD